MVVEVAHIYYGDILSITTSYFGRLRERFHFNLEDSMGDTVGFLMER